jgi:hypothetical protein
MRRLGGVVLVIQIAVIGVLVTPASPAIAATRSQVAAKVLSLQDMPTGWSVDNSRGGGASDIGGCLKGLVAIKKPVKGIQRVKVAYHYGAFPALQEIIEAGPGTEARYRKFTGILNGCKTFGFTADGNRITGTVGAMSFPTVGASSRAYALSLTTQGQTVGIDLVFFKVGQFDGELLYGDISPDPNTIHGFATEAVDKILGKRANPPVTPTTTGTSPGSLAMNRGNQSARAS